MIIIITAIITITSIVSLEPFLKGIQASYSRLLIDIPRSLDAVNNLFISFRDIVIIVMELQFVT